MTEFCVTILHRLYKMNFNLSWKKYIKKTLVNSMNILLQRDVCIYGACTKVWDLYNPCTFIKS
jgi:hypothetical protein